MSKEIIYVNGDSFTEGVEIESHLSTYFKNYYYSLNTIRELKNNKDFIKDKNLFLSNLYNIDYFDSENKKDIYKYREENRWSGQLENILGKPVANLSSTPGCCNTSIAFRSLYDINNLKLNDYTITDVIIQLTSSYRYTIYHTDKYSKTNSYLPTVNYNIQSANMGTIDTFGSIAEKMALLEGDFSSVRYYYEIFNMLNAIKSITNARIILVDSLFLSEKIFNGPPKLNEKLGSGHFLFDFKENLLEQVKLKMIDFLEPDESDTMTMGNHFTAKVHHRFAEAIAKEYFNE